MPDRMYSKHDTRNNAVFSEFLMLDLSGSIMGGINLLSINSLVKWALEKSIYNCIDLPWFLPDNQESDSLDGNADCHLAKQRRQHLAGDKVGHRPLLSKLREGTGPAHYHIC